jgi:isopenicillin-N N-acyltransferase-like protein
MTTPRKIPFIDVAGEPRERGRAYGELAAAQIESSIGYYAQALAARPGLPWDEVCSRARRWVPHIEEFAGDLLDEVRGIAEGSKRSFEEIVALNGRGEIVYDSSFADLDADGCSSFGLLAEATGDGHVYCGQNWDWRSGVRDSIVMLRVSAPGKPTIVMQVEAGQVGRHGASSAGLGLQANGLGGRFANGLAVPQPFIRRRILESRTLKQALDVAFTARLQISANLLLVHRDGVAINVEATPGRNAWMYPTDGILVHGNHFQAFVPEEIAATYRPFATDSLYRVPRIERALVGCRRAPDTGSVREAIAGAMGDHFGFPDSVCAHADGSADELLRYETLVSTIVDLTTGEYLVAAGPPCSTPYEPLAVGLYDDVEVAA